MSKTYVINLETGHVELHCLKSEYKALPESQKSEIKSAFLWSRSADAWVSRSTRNHYSALRVAEKLGFTSEGKIGERLSYEEELNRKAEKAEHRAERFKGYAHNAVDRAKGLQKEFESHHGDIAYFTQPIISGHAGSQAFGNRRQRVFDRYEKGFQEYRKSEYFREKAITAQNTAEMAQLKDKVYLDNRIKECNSRIRKLQTFINSQQQRETPNEEYLSELLDKMEYQMDKLAFFENCLDELGGVTYNQSNVKAGYLVKIRGHWDKVLKANKTTIYAVSIEITGGIALSYPYAEIQELKIPESWTEETNAIENPFMIGDILVQFHHWSDTKIAHAYRVMKTTEKTVTIREVKVQDNKPLKNTFVNERTERRMIAKDRQGRIVANNGSFYIYKYEEPEEIQEAQ